MYKLVYDTAQPQGNECLCVACEWIATKMWATRDWVESWVTCMLNICEWLASKCDSQEECYTNNCGVIIHCRVTCHQKFEEVVNKT